MTCTKLIMWYYSDCNNGKPFTWASFKAEILEVFDSYNVRCPTDFGTVTAWPLLRGHTQARFIDYVSGIKWALYLNSVNFIVLRVLLVRNEIEHNVVQAGLKVELSSQFLLVTADLKASPHQLMAQLIPFCASHWQSSYRTPYLGCSSLSYPCCFLFKPLCNLPPPQLLLFMLCLIYA